MPVRIVRDNINTLNADAVVEVTVSDFCVPGELTVTFRDDSVSGDRKVSVEAPESRNLPGYYESVLTECYMRALRLAATNNCESIAVPILGAGLNIMHYNDLVNIAMNAFSMFLDDHDMDIYMSLDSAWPLSDYYIFHGELEQYIRRHYIDPEPVCFSISADGGGGPGGGGRPKPLPPVSASTNSRTESPQLMEAVSYYEAASPKQKSAPESSFSRLRKSIFSAGRSQKSDTSLYDGEDLYAEKAVAEDSEAAVLNEPSLNPSARKLEDLLDIREKNFMDMVFYYADMKGMTDVEVRKRANLDKKAFSKLKCGNTRRPSQTTALAFAIALKLNLDETKDLLARAGMALSPCSRTDIIVQYFIEQEVYDIYAINIALFEHGEMLLGSQAVD